MMPAAPIHQAGHYAQIRGRAAEDAALDYLVRQGLTLLQRNYRCRSGEIDLIMQHRETVVFVEVRARADRRFGGAAASVTASKRARLVAAAQMYLQRSTALPACRFDVIAIDGEGLSWLQNVIEA